MGQRLNLSINSNGEVLANCYYHWSGFTASALTLVKKVLCDKLLRKKDVKIDRNLAVELLINTGAGFLNTDCYSLENELPNYLLVSAKDRNSGIIEIEEKGIKETEYWAEQTAIIDLENKTVDVREMLWEVDEEVYEVEKCKIKVYDYDFSCVDFENIYIIDEICYLSRYYSYNFIAIDKNGNKYAIVE